MAVDDASSLKSTALPTLLIQAPVLQQLISQKFISSLPYTEHYKSRILTIASTSMYFYMCVTVQQLTPICGAKTEQMYSFTLNIYS